MLDGLDRAWSAPTAATEAGYSNLPPRAYRFRVIASNADGVWNGAEATLPLDVEPMFWQTLWFYVAMVWRADSPSSLSIVIGCIGWRGS
jgi:hypothetical protein